MKKIVLKIKKIIEYIPVLWKDEDWDYAYLLELIKYKASMMKKAIIANDYVVKESIDEICNSIDITIKSIDDYFNSDDLFEEEFGDIYKELNLERKWKKLENGNSKLITVYKGTDNEIKPRHEAKISKYYDKMILFEQDKWNDIWDNLKKYSNRWWD